MISTPPMINAFKPEDIDHLKAEDRALVLRRQAVLGPSYRLFYDQPFHPVRAAGCWLYDTDGQAYLDAYNNVPSVGHCHPHVVEAVHRQLATLNTHTRYLGNALVDYAERLLRTLPPAINRVMLTSTGSEANDLAVRVARMATGHEGIIITRLAYHGITHLIAGLSPSLGPGRPEGAHVYHVDAPLDSASGADVGEAFAAGVRAVLQDMTNHGVKPAALLVDTIFSSDGIYADPAGFLTTAVKAVRDAGGLFIADEVQPGFGRTGEAFWGFARHGLTPDIVTIGKPMGNGYPVAAMLAQQNLLDSFGRSTRYFNTFGGSNVAIAAANAVLDVLEQDQLQQRALVVGNHLRDGFKALQQRHPVISAVRGAGLFIGVELGQPDDPVGESGRFAHQVVNWLRRNRVLVSATGPGANILKIRPPLCFGMTEAGYLVDSLDHALSECGIGLKRQD